MPLKGKQNVSNAVDDLVEFKDKQLKAIWIDGMQKIVLGTPVDEGRARNSWALGVDRMPSNAQRSAESSGATSISSIKKIPKRVIGRKLFYVNNIPYINKLEYGGFPNPAVNPQKTVGGFSDQAPRGWVRKELLRMRKKIRAIR